MRVAVVILLAGALTGCAGNESTETTEEPVETPSTAMATYGDDVSFLRQHQDVIELTDPAGKARVAVVAEYQGRVMTSTSGGEAGPSYGWIHREAVAANERQPHINVFGGEDRFWLGPEGGQYSIFFKAGDPFDLEHWQTPEPIDWGPWETAETSAMEARFHRTIELTNYSGTKLSLEADRSVRLLSPEEIVDKLGADVPAGVEAVAFESSNTIANAGDAGWTKDKGLLSIWILGMFNPSPTTTIVLPFAAGPESELGPIVNDAYFGKVPADRLVVGDGVLFFRGDGKYRSKIGISRRRALPIAGSYDSNGGVLTLVQYTLPEDETDYVNSMWELSDRPYEGDVVNSYNDGPPEPGAKPLGPFYELETSSPAAELLPAESFTHVHRTFHLRGPESELDAIARATLGVALADVVAAFQ